MLRYFFLIFFSFHISFYIYSQPPQAFKYQACIRNDKGVTLKNKDVDVKISILNNSINGNVVYSEKQSVKSNNAGIISLDVGYGQNISGSFSSLEWGKGNCFIKLELDTSKTSAYIDFGTTKLLSVPYSLNSGGVTLLSPDGSHWDVKVDNRGNFYSVNLDIDTTFKCEDNLKDTRDGQIYKTVRIGTQCWMAQNLNIGTMIDGTKTPGDFNIIEKYCPKNSNSYCEQYGALYTWDEAMDNKTAENVRGICPISWHLPSDVEWKSLELSLGMLQQSVDSSAWRGSNQASQLLAGGTSKFEALLPGTRHYDSGSMDNFGIFTGFWTSTIFDSSKSTNRSLSSTLTKIYRGNSFRMTGFSVRCLKDN